jgi:AcrR family transcriptional regulator
VWAKSEVEMADELSRVQKRQKKTREKIFRVAMELFQRQGFEQTTVAQITEVADIGKGTFFTYFPTKEAVFAYLGETVVEGMAAVVNHGLESGEPVSSVLQQLFEAAASWHEANHSLTEQALLAGLRVTFVREVDAPNQQRMVALLTTTVETGQARGEFWPEVNAEEAAVALTGVYFAIVLAWTLEVDTAPLADRLRSALHLFLRGLAA